MIVLVILELHLGPHKYAYVHGDPIQGIDPTGEARFLSRSVMRLAAGLGAAAAAYIFLGLMAEYTLREAYLREVNNRNVQTRSEQIGRVTDTDLPPTGFHPSFRLKPDILDLRLKAYYEIKPDHLLGRALGVTQLVDYSFALARRFPNEIYLPGSWTPQGIYLAKLPAWLGGLPAPAVIVARRAASGLIVYDQKMQMIQAFAFGLGVYAAMSPSSLKRIGYLARLLGKEARDIKLPPGGVQSPWGGGRPIGSPVSGILSGFQSSFAFSFSFSFG